MCLRQKRFGAYLLLSQLPLVARCVSLGCGSIVSALEVPVKELSNVVNLTLSGSSSRVIRGKL